jgi:hypothetical protein
VGSWVLVLLLGSGPSWAAPPTGTGTDDTGLQLPEDTGATEPGDTDTDTDTETEDTGPAFCPDCVSAGDLAGEKGGSPCGCSSAGAGLLGLLWIPALVAARRRV